MTAYRVHCLDCDRSLPGADSVTCERVAQDHEFRTGHVTSLQFRVLQRWTSCRYVPHGAYFVPAP